MGVGESLQRTLVFWIILVSITRSCFSLPVPPTRKSSRDGLIVGRDFLSVFIGHQLRGHDDVTEPSPEYAPVKLSGTEASSTRSSNTGDHGSVVKLTLYTNKDSLVTPSSVFKHDFEVEEVLSKTEALFGVKIPSNNSRKASSMFGRTKDTSSSEIISTERSSIRQNSRSSNKPALQKLQVDPVEINTSLVKENRSDRKNVERLYGTTEHVYASSAHNYAEPDSYYAESIQVYSHPKFFEGTDTKYSMPERKRPSTFQTIHNYSKNDEEGSEEELKDEEIKVKDSIKSVEEEKREEQEEMVPVKPETKEEEIDEEEYDEEEREEKENEDHDYKEEEGMVSTAPEVLEVYDKDLDNEKTAANHKFGYVVEGRNFRKFRVEEKTDDGYIVGEYGVVNNNDGKLRGVQYTADGTINPKLIYEALMKFLKL